MFVPDYVKTVKTVMAADWVASQPDWAVTLEVADDYAPVAGHPVLLVADDGGPAVIGGAWMLDGTPYRPVLRMTAFAAGRTEARAVVVEAVKFVKANRPGIARIESISVPLITKDRETGAWLASVTAPVIVRQTNS